MTRANNSGSSQQGGVPDGTPPATRPEPHIPDDNSGLFSSSAPGFGGKSPPALFSIAVATAIVLISIGDSITRRVADNQYSPGFAARVTETRIDPNTASWASLVRIPSIGPARAEKLLAWRKRHRSRATPVVFQNMQDLRHVPSFGPKTLLSISRYLRFPKQISTGGVSVVKSTNQASVPGP